MVLRIDHVCFCTLKFSRGSINWKGSLATSLMILMLLTSTKCQTDSTEYEANANVALEGQCVIVCDAEPAAIKSGTVERTQNGPNAIGDLWNKMRSSCGDLASAAYRTRKIAFSAIRSKSLATTKSQPRLDFDYISVNVGNAFEAGTGTFRSPARGVYSFTFEVFRIYNSGTLNVHLKKNDVTVFEGFAAGSNSIDSAHNQGLLHLEAGDVVYLQTMEGDMSGGWVRSTFSGYLIFEDL